MSTHTPAVDELILRIHAAPLEPGGWHLLIDSLRQLFRAQRAMVCNPAPRSLEEFWCVPIGFDAETLELYASQFAPADIWLAGAVRSRRTATGVVSLDDELVDRHTFIRSAFFNEFLLPHDIDRLLGACFGPPRREDRLPQIMFSLYRGVGEDAFSNDDAELLKVLVPHLVTATSNFLRAESLALRSAIQHQVLDSVNAAVVGIDGSGSVVFTNRAADSVFQAGEWLRTIGRRLAPGKNVLEKRACRDAIQQLLVGVGTNVLLTEGVTKRQGLMSSVPLACSSQDYWPYDGVVGLIWLVPGSTGTGSVRILAKMFELTHAEERLLRVLVDGAELKECAAVLGISIHTARNQLKSIFRKTGRRTQGQLLALATRLALMNSQ